MIFDEVAARFPGVAIPETPPAPAPPTQAEPTVHNATTCAVCQEWLAHVREAEDL